MATCRVFSFVILIGAVLGLSACAAPPTETAPPVGAVEMPAETAPDPEPDVVLPLLDTLAAATAAQVVAVLGEPALKRADPPAELWQYRNDSCVLALYLYHGQPSDPVTVTHMEAHDDNAKRMDTEACFHALLRDKG